MKKHRKPRKSFYDYLMIAAGVMLLAVSISVFLEPLSLITGGVSGLAIIIRSLGNETLGVDIPLWLTNTALNLPLFVIGTKARGMRFLRRTVFATLFLSLCLFFTEMFAAWFLPKMGEIDNLLGAVFGAALGGTGLGLVFRCSSTTGGSDLAASIINRYKPGIAISKAMFAIDSCIITLGLFVFGPVKAMYAIISVFITSQIINTVLEGLSFAKAAFIISEKSAEIGQKVLSDMQRGATALSGRGLFTQKSRDVIMCVTSSKEIVALKGLVTSIDENAFIIVADVREVLGEGFSKN